MDSGGLMHMRRHFRRQTRGAVKCHVEQPKHIECGEQAVTAPTSHHRRLQPAGFDGAGKNFVLTPETSKRKDTRNRQRRHTHRPVRRRQDRPQVAHFAHILLTAQGMDDRPGSKKQQGFEEGVRDQVKDPRGIRP